MQIADLIVDLRQDLADVDHILFSDAALERCISKAVFYVSRDLGNDWQIVDQSIQPPPSWPARELVVLLSQIHACQRMRAASANVIDVSSGSFSVDKTRTPAEWANLEKDLRAQYQRQLTALQPATETTECDNLLTPKLNSLIYGEEVT